MKTFRYALITTAVGALMMPAAAMAQSSAADHARTGGIHGQDGHSRMQMDNDYRAWRDQQMQRMDQDFQSWSSERAAQPGDLQTKAERSRSGTIHGQDSIGDKYSRSDMDREYQEWRESQMERLDREYDTWSSDRWDSMSPQTGSGVEPTQTGSGATTGNVSEEPVTGSGSRAR